jgi:CheY-like chemotaxis protein
MKILILDDDQTRHLLLSDQYRDMEQAHVTTAAKAIAAVRSERFDVVTLDHDLGDWQHNTTGTDVVRAIVSLPAEARPARVIMHTGSSRDGLRCLEMLRAAGIPSAWEPAP